MEFALYVQLSIWKVVNKKKKKSSQWDFSSKNTGVGCHFLLQGINPDPGIEPGSPAWQVIYQLSHQDSPYKLKLCVILFTKCSGSDIKNLPAMQETQLQSLEFRRSPAGGHGNPLQDSCLEPGRLQSMGGRVGHAWATDTFKWTSSVLESKAKLGGEMCSCN